MRPVVLRSNFVDYYDDYFDSPSSISPLIFERFTDKGMRRGEILKFLARNGFSVPKHGILRDIGKWAPHLRDNQYIVIYLDEYSHRGENKLLSTIDVGLKSYPNCLAAEFLGKSSDSAHALRLVQVGMKYFWISLQSDDWRASSGNVKTSIKKHGHGLQSNLFYPLWAIDFVPVNFGGNEVLYAVDFSSAPILGENDMDKILDAPTAVKEIKQMVNTFVSR
ncbi:hypothetical protein [Sporomusa malonica]|uniref:Uncharacterized protein n=1 Tax=Sporomusa malonica TaxID=112901 RepID=A0A1W2C3Z9_9FIRM|nr:hypothetical protein [Sporomusa malonica]SMC79836.1 hypothetical protein SAMN04488500_109118 [Sporomusa malonica]